MKRLRVSPKTLFVLLIAITVLCSPSFNILFYKFQFAALPESWNSLAIQLRAIPPVTICIWLLIAFLSPIASAIIFLAIFFDWRFESRDKIRFAAATLWIISWSTLWIGTNHINARQKGLVYITERGKPIIAAIEKYHADKGNYPAKLEVLLPNHLNEIPYTGVVGYPKFEYKLADTTISKESPDDDSKKYELFIPMPYLNPLDEHSDYFVYWPEKQYPNFTANGLALYQVGDWAYAEILR